MPGWKIFYEEDLYVKKKVIHTFSSQLALKEKKPVEEEDEEMIWDLFEVMALDDHIHLIYFVPKGKGKEVTSDNVMGGYY